MNRLRYFCTLNQTGNMRKAAELLGLSPAALSKAMSVLETEMGYRLTAPAGRGIVITDRGRALAARAAELLRDFESLRHDGETTASERAPLRIGSFEVFTTYFLGEMIEREFAEEPLAIHELVPGQMEAALSAGKIDIALTYIPVPAPDLDHLRVTEIGMGVYGRGSPKFSETRVERMPFVIPIIPITGSPNKAQGLDGWPDDRIPRMVKYRVSLLETAMEFCRRGLAVAYLPDFVVRLHNRRVLEKYRLREIPPPRGLSAAKQPIYIVKRKSDLEDGRVKKIAKALRMAARG